MLSPRKHRFRDWPRTGSTTRPPTGAYPPSWACRPDANIGAATGSIVAIDIDPPPMVVTAALAELESQAGHAADDMARADRKRWCPSLFPRPDSGSTIRNSAGRLGPGIDIVVLVAMSSCHRARM